MEIMHFRNDDYEGFVKKTIESGFSEKVLEYPDGVLLRKPGTLQYIVVITNRQDHVTDATWYASSTSPEEDYKDECDKEDSILPFALFEGEDDEPFFRYCPIDKIVYITGYGLLLDWQKVLVEAEKDLKEW